MEKQEKIRQYERALEMWGVTAQFKMLVEEVGELFAALGKFDRRRVKEDDVITEIADASIMVEQMATLFGYDRFEAEKDRKRTDKSFMVPKKEIADNDYDLSINKYKQTEYMAVEYPPTSEILDELDQLNDQITKELKELRELLKEG